MTCRSDANCSLHTFSLMTCHDRQQPRLAVPWLSDVCQAMSCSSNHVHLAFMASTECGQNLLHHIIKKEYAGGFMLHKTMNGYMIRIGGHAPHYVENVFLALLRA
eukprot:2566137-Amphidinium_carterae.1